MLRSVGVNREICPLINSSAFITSGVAIGPVGGLVLGSVFGVLLIVAAISFGAQCIKLGSSAPGIAAGRPQVLNARNDVAPSRSVGIKAQSSDQSLAPSVEEGEVPAPGGP